MSVEPILAKHRDNYRPTSDLILSNEYDFPEEAVPLVVTIFRLLSVLSPDQLLVWFPEAINSVPMAAAYGPAKQQLLEDYTA